MSKRQNRRDNVTRKGLQLAWAIAEHERIREENERVTGAYRGDERRAATGHAADSWEHGGGGIET